MAASSPRKRTITEELDADNDVTPTGDAGIDLRGCSSMGISTGTYVNITNADLVVWFRIGGVWRKVRNASYTAWPSDTAEEFPTGGLAERGYAAWDLTATAGPILPFTLTAGRE